MNDPRIAIIRMILACLASAVLWNFSVWWCWVPIALMMPPLFTVACTRCDGDTAPNSFQVDLSGFTDGSCTSCATYNDSFVVTWLTNGILGCTYYSPQISSGYCSSCQYVGVFLSGGGPITITVNITNRGFGTCGSGGTMITWEETGVTPDPNCMTFSSRVVPYSSDPSNPCTHDFSDAMVTTL